MFDIGFSELFVIALVALLVLGPERLPKATRFAGLWVRRARAQWYSVKSELENELADDELKRSLLQTRDQLQDEMRQARDGLQHSTQALRREFETEGHAPESEPLPEPAASDAAEIPSARNDPLLPPVDDHHDRR
ncbi:MAG: Sec-independent protein translocase protein TatB [Lysobacter sp.]